MFNCVSCGDSVSARLQDRLNGVRRECLAVSDELIITMRDRCTSCALEIVVGIIPKVGSASSHGTGGGQRVIRESKTH